MSLFSMSWFKSHKEKELESLKVEEQRIKNDLLRNQLYRGPIDPVTPVEPQLKLYKSLRLVNDVLTIVLNDGSIVSKSSATIEDFKNIKEAITELDVLAVLSDKSSFLLEKNHEEVKEVIKGLEILKHVPDFEVIDGSIYMKGIKRSMPQLLIEKFVSIISQYNDFNKDGMDDVEYTSLKKFWLKCCLNPNAQSAEDLYTFLTHHQFKIDKHGNFYAYRRVISKNDASDRELIDFISNTYNKVKAVWKKNPANYIVYKRNNMYGFSEYTGKELDKGLGNLKDLYLDLPNMKTNSYTDAHTRTWVYRVGEVISMPRHKGDDNNHISCSRGFHSASKAYDYSGFGDTPILMIINPIDVLAVPLNEVGKLRVCRWFFAMTLTEDEKYILDEKDFDVSELGDIFEEKCMENLTEHVQNSFAEEVQRHTFQIPQLSAGEVNTIVNSLEKMKEAIDNRVSVIN